jgi:hypothetical protein
VALRIATPGYGYSRTMRPHPRTRSKLRLFGKRANQAEAKRRPHWPFVFGECPLTSVGIVLGVEDRPDGRELAHLGAYPMPEEPSLTPVATTLTVLFLS